MRISLCAALAVLAAVSPVYGGDQYDWQSWGEASDTLRSVTRGARLTLGSAFIKEGSERVAVNGFPLTGSEYDINYQRGLLRINSAIPESATVVVSYVRLPVLLNSVYTLRNIDFADPQEDIPDRKPIVKQSEPALNPTGNLDFGGMKSISFAVGTNKGTSIDQALRATVEGDVTSSIHVKALLSDNNLPIQPEGNTQELEYLDKVFVEITGPHAKATLGDFATGYDFTSFSSFRRELKGASGEVSAGKTRLSLTGGESKGVFRTVKFRGSSQLQGPYELLSQGRVTGEVVIAGTERVYLDGELLQRGKNRDYTIDYNRGTLTFTPLRPITADSEIAVDFEVTQQQYERTSLFGSVQSADLPAGFSVYGMVARENDDPDRPKSLTLDDNDKTIIAGAGANEELAIAGGVTSVDSGNGSYRRVPAEPTGGLPEHYVFDDSTGSYELNFVEVRSGRGDYTLGGISKDGRPIFVYAGVGKGNYVIGRQLPLPQTHDVVATRLSRDGRHVMLDLEYNVSNFDANSLSPLDDDNNVGDAGALRFGLRQIPVGFGDVEVIGSISTLEDNFRSLERTRPSYFYRDWNLENDALEGRELLSEIATAFTRGKSMRLDYTIGRLERNQFNGVKQEGRAALVRAKDQTLGGRAFVSRVDGDDQQRSRYHGTVNAAYGLWDVVPSLTYSTEEFRVNSPVLPDSGIAYDRYVVRMDKRNVRTFSYSLAAEERDTRALADTTDGWIESRRDRSMALALGAHGLNTLQGELQYSHRVVDDWIFDDVRTSDLARVKGQLRLDRIGVRSNFDYEISQNQARTQRKSVVFVGEGKGDYNELGEPVGKGRGDYMLVFLPTQETVPTQAVDMSLHLSWNSRSTTTGKTGGSGPMAWVRSNVSLEQVLSVTEETTFGDPYKVYLLFPSALQRDDATLHGIVSLRQDWSFLNSYPNVSLTFRYQRDDEEENRYAPAKEERFAEQQVVRLDRSLSQLVSLNIEGRRETRRRGGTGLQLGTGSTYDVAGWALVGGWGLRFSTGSTLDGAVEYRWQKDAESEALEQAIALKPRFVWRINRALNVFGRYEITRFVVDEANGVRPFFFANPGTAQRWSLTPNLRVSRVISMLATYEGRSETTFSGKRIVEHDFRVETRAYF